jgi:hypothetical protein
MVYPEDLSFVLTTINSLVKISEQPQLAQSGAAAAGDNAIPTSDNSMPPRGNQQKYLPIFLKAQFHKHAN